MASGSLRVEPSRDSISHAILESLKSWPALPRQVFVEIHYQGRSVEEVASSRGISADEVARILGFCERRLYRALHILLGEASPGVMEQTDRHAGRIRNGCIF